MDDFGTTRFATPHPLARRLTTPTAHSHQQNKTQVRPTGASAQEYQTRESSHAAHTARVNPAFINAAMMHFIQSMMEGAQPANGHAAAGVNGSRRGGPDPGVE